jgi:DMSO/TMAO reductase YedYZ molybdopterin-dependent catalytic subunit
MVKPRISTGALVGGLLTAPMIALMYLADQLAELTFAPFDLFNWMAQLLPGPVITFGIDLLIDTLRLLGIDVADTAKLAEQGMAVGLFLIIGILLGLVCYWILNLREMLPNWLDGLVIGALFGLPMVAINVAYGEWQVNPWVDIIWQSALFLVWGSALGMSYRAAVPSLAEPEVRTAQRISRRTFLITLGGSAAAITVAGTGIGAFLARSEKRQRAEAMDDSMAHQTEGARDEPFPNINAAVTPAPGTRPEYTPLMDHYKVFIELEPTQIEGSTWMLPITGLVDNDLLLTIDDLRENYPQRDQFVTISCISGRVGTSLIGTTLWTGVSLQDVLAEVGVQPEARYLHITSADGFYEDIDLELINSDDRIMLCHSWDGNPLPSDHGFPLRIWIPDRYGMKQPKWITGIEVSDEYQEGYWVERGWDEVAQVKTTSVIDTVAVDAIYESGGQRMVPIGGIAFSGDRGISKVEVRMDGGSWQEAQLRTPLSETTWVIWRYDWPFNEGSHTFEVRCAEGDGTPQIEASTSARPDGSTGIHNREAEL